MKVLIASDSFKGSLDTFQVAEIIKNGALKVFPHAEFKTMPVADGGEGTVAALISSLGGTYEKAIVRLPNGGRRTASYGILKNGIAILEMAEASGLTLIQEADRDIMAATTYGTGEMIKKAMDQGCKKIYIGIGGSATNDGGVGMAQALGASFLDKDGREVKPGGGSLKDIETIHLENMDRRLKDTEIIVMCDVTNPLYGPDGAASVYGPQKGAALEDIQTLDQGLENLADKMCALGYPDIRWEKGSGAAGGMGWGLVLFTGAVLMPGIDAILDICDFDRAILWADLVVTGEGQIDHQSVCGKVIDGITKRAVRQGKPVIAIAGSLSDNARSVYQVGVGSLAACVSRPMNVHEAMENAERYLETASERIFRAIRIGMELKTENGG